MSEFCILFPVIQTHLPLLAQIDPSLPRIFDVFSCQGECFLKEQEKPVIKVFSSQSQSCEVGGNNRTQIANGVVMGSSACFYGHSYQFLKI